MVHCERDCIAHVLVRLRQMIDERILIGASHLSGGDDRINGLTLQRSSHLRR
jgi:hypothetical protein